MLALTLALAVAAGAASTPEPPLTAKQIMERVTARFEANQVAREGLEYRKTEVVSDLDENFENPALKRTGTWRMWIKGGVMNQVKLSEDGQAVTNGKIGKPGVDITAGITKFFDFELGTPAKEDVHGYSCWVVKFTPHGRTKPEGLNEEITSRMSGTFWIDAQGFWIRKSSGHMQSRYTKRKIGIPLGSVYDAFFSMEEQEVLGAIMPLTATMDVHYEKLILDYWERYEYRYDEFRPLDTTNRQ